MSFRFSVFLCGMTCFITVGFYVLVDNGIVYVLF